jgi:hypothetical protein
MKADELNEIFDLLKENDVLPKCIHLKVGVSLYEKM